MQPDFYTGSAHKWPCGPKEVGVLYVNTSAQGRIHPSIISAYPGAIGVSRTMEAMGQRDEPAIIGFGEALNFQTKIGRTVIEERSRALTQASIAGLRRIEGVEIWTHADPARSGAVVTFRPGDSRCPEAFRRALSERSDRLRDPKWQRSPRHPLFAALLQHDG